MAGNPLPVGQLVGEGRWNLLAVQPLGDGPVAFSGDPQAVDAADDFGGLLVDLQPVFVRGAFFITVGGKGAEVVPPFSLYVKAGDGFDGNIPAVGVIQQVFKGQQHTVRGGQRGMAVIIIVDSDKADAQAGKDLLDITPCLNIVSPEPGQVFYDHAVDSAVLYGL